VRGKDSEKRERQPLGKREIISRIRGVLVEGQMEWHMLVHKSCWDASEFSSVEVHAVETKERPSSRFRMWAWRMSGWMVEIEVAMEGSTVVVAVLEEHGGCVEKDMCRVFFVSLQRNTLKKGFCAGALFECSSHSTCSLYIGLFKECTWWLVKGP
jgi:hypothetical protein